MKDEGQVKSINSITIQFLRRYQVHKETENNIKSLQASISLSFLNNYSIFHNVGIVNHVSMGYSNTLF